MIFSLLMSLAVIHLLLKPMHSPGLKRPSSFFAYWVPAAHLFGMLLLLYGIGFLFRRFWGDFSDLAPGAMLLAAFGAGKGFKLPEPLIVMTYAAGVFIAMEPFTSALFHAALMSLGVTGVEWLADGMRFRLAFTPSSKYFSTLPGLLLLLALTALVLSGFFTKFLI